RRDFVQNPGGGVEPLVLTGLPLDLLRDDLRDRQRPDRPEKKALPVEGEEVEGGACIHHRTMAHGRSPSSPTPRRSTSTSGSSERTVSTRIPRSVAIACALSTPASYASIALERSPCGARSLCESACRAA